MRLSLSSLLLATACACNGAGGGDDVAGSRARSRGDAVVGGDVIATVDGSPIDRAIIVHAARAAEVSPRVALERLVDEELLAAEAARAGLAEDPEVVRSVRRAAVQVLLERDVEAQITEASIDPAEIEEAYAQAPPARFARPERRRSAHVFARVPEGAPPALAAAARSWVEGVHAELAAADDPLGLVRAMGRRPPEEQPFETNVEEVPPVAREGEADPAYARALFDATEPGLVREPVESELGWHAVLLTEIVPAWQASREEALSMLRAERLAALRARRLEERVRELAASTPVRVDPVGMQRVLEDPLLLGVDE